MRYLLFPGLGECCACCSAAEGCGILDPHWLDGAEFIGQVGGWVAGVKQPDHTWHA
jgi:hypothetical protein